MEKTMRALVAGGPGSFSVKQIPVPVPERDEVLCRIKSVAICGTDPELFAGKFVDIKWPPKYPFVFGHEWAGEVVAVGADVIDFAIGDRVAGEAHCGCGHCENCRKGDYTVCLNYGNIAQGHRHYGFTVQGAYAEYGAYKTKAIEKMPASVSFDEATMCDTAGVALHAVELGNVGSCQTVAIIGPGPIGNLAMQICKAKGARTIMIGRRDRLEYAKECGADYTINYENADPVEEVKKITGGKGADVVIECAGTPVAISESILCTRKNGNDVLVSLPKVRDIPVSILTIVQNQIHVIGSKANPNCSKKVLQMIDSNMINAKKLITHQFDLSEMEKALDIFVHKIDGVMKVVIHP